jgi:hypothetical protein
MSTVIAVWPDNTTSVVVFPGKWSAVDLFYELDHIGDPLSTRVYVIRRHGPCPTHATTDWAKTDPALKTQDISGKPDAGCAGSSLQPSTKRLRVRLAGDEGSVKKFDWPPNVVRQFLFASWRDRLRDDSVREAALSAECGKMLESLPSPPPPQYTAKEVNQMQPFSGVYVAWNDDATAHYVGESLNVPSRVQASRPEIGDRMLGVVQCDKNERLRIEALFIGLLNPAGNSQSLERAAARDSMRSKRTV